MYFVNVMYPSSATGFNLEHYTNIHLPLGLGLLRKHFDVTPEQVVLHSNTFGLDRTSDSAPYAAITSMAFKTRADAERFIDLFEIESAAALLTADWPNFTSADPVVVMGSTGQISTDAILEKAPAVIEHAARDGGTGRTSTTPAPRG